MFRKISQFPYIIWSALFIIVPLILIIYYSLTTKDGSLTFDNYQKLANPLFFDVFLRSFILAVKATIICLILGYPVAVILSQLAKKPQRLFLMLLLLPMWMNFLLRTYAWMAILGNNGIINRFVSQFGWHFELMYNSNAVLLGMVYNFLPFMILPIYTVLTKLDNDYIEAAKDLGAKPFRVFTRVTLPLSLPGIMSGITMVFMPAVSTFVISNLLGGKNDLLIGNLIEQQFLVLNNWHFGSSISIILMTMIILLMGLVRLGNRQEEGVSHLW